jgi:hypothetical protein
MPPRGVKSAKRERQYEHIKTSLKRKGRSEGTASRIAAATTNQTRTAKGETKEKKSATERRRAKSDMSAAGRKGSRARARKSTARKSTRKTTRRSS